MADFPPNPEDGELWLPSYILHEISTKSSSLANENPKNSNPKNKVVFPPQLRRNNNPQDSKANLVEICFGSFGTNNGAAAAANNDNNKFAPPAAIISLHKPVLTPNTTLQVFEGTGTGVFLPRSMNVIGKKPKEMSGGSGTGFFLNHQVAVPCQRKKTSDKEEEALGMNHTKKCFPIIQEETFGYPENYQHALGICLPKDWTY